MELENNGSEIAFDKVKDNRKRGKSVLLLLWVVLGLEVLCLVSSYWESDLLLRVQNGGVYTEEALEFNDLRQGVVGMLYVVMFIVSFVVFICWFRRAYYNLHVLRRGLLFSEGWAAGCWFVPFVNLYRPLQIMNELYDEMDRWLSKQLSVQVLPSGAGILSWWWGFWLLDAIVGWVGFRLPIDTLEEMIRSSYVTMGSGVIGVVSTLLTIKVIRGYRAKEILFYGSFAKQ